MRCYICDEPLKHIHNDPMTGKVAPCETCQAVINGLLPEEPLHEAEFDITVPDDITDEEQEWIEQFLAKE